MTGEGAEGDEDEAVEAARERVIEAFARSAEVYGINRSYGRLYGVLYFAEEPLSLDELTERGGYAKSTVSTAMSTLERLHFVQRRSLPGEGKRAYFEAETDFWYIVHQLLDQQARREIAIVTRALDDAEETLEATDSARAERDLERVRALRRMYDQVQRLIDLLTSRPIERFVDLLEGEDEE